MNFRRIEIWIPLLVSVIAAFGMLIGMKFDQSLSKDGLIKAYIPSDDEAVYEAVQHINEKYYGAIDTNELTDEAIRSMISTLDDYSNYWDGMHHHHYKNYINGIYEGRGLEVFPYADRFYVTNVVADSPAEESGVMRGDEIIALDEVVMDSSVSMDSLHILMRADRTLDITVLRGDDEIKYKVAQRQIDVPSTKTLILGKDSIIYSRINQFSQHAYRSFMEDLEELKNKGHRVEHLILDLRSNPGGLLDESVKILNQMISEPQVTLVSTIDNKENMTEYKSNGRTFINLDRIVVLIDERSASASEIVAGSLQDLDRAVVVGQHSFGKGKIQQNYELSNGGSISLTVGEYLLPSGRSIAKGSAVDLDTVYTIHQKRPINVEYGVGPDVLISDSCDIYRERDYIAYLIENEQISINEITSEDAKEIANSFTQNRNVGSCREYISGEMVWFLSETRVAEPYISEEFFDLHIAEAYDIITTDRYDQILSPQKL